MTTTPTSEAVEALRALNVACDALWNDGHAFIGGENREARVVQIVKAQQKSKRALAALEQREGGLLVGGNRVAEAAIHLRDNQRQLDQDGVMVGVSREALETVLGVVDLAMTPKPEITDEDRQWANESLQDCIGRRADTDSPTPPDTGQVSREFLENLLFENLDVEVGIVDGVTHINIETGAAVDKLLPLLSPSVKERGDG